MHIHSQPMNWNAHDMHSSAAAATQQAAEVRRRMMKENFHIDGEAESFESFMIEQGPYENPQQQRRNPARTPQAFQLAEEESTDGKISIRG